MCEVIAHTNRNARTGHHRSRSDHERSHPPAAMKTLIHSAMVAILLASSQAPAQIPQLINYQGRVAVQGVNFDGNGQFKFALVDATGTISYWPTHRTQPHWTERPTIPCP